MQRTETQKKEFTDRSSELWDLDDEVSQESDRPKDDSKNSDCSNESF